MKFRKFLKYILIIFVILIIVSIYLFNRTGKMIYGGLTHRVNHEQFEPKTGNFAITDVNVLSIDSKIFIPGQTVLIEHGLIKLIDTSATIPDNAQIIDGSGKFLIPGLVDAHVHLFQSPNDLLLYIANGVTEIRELIGEPAHLKWRDEIENGRIGPRMFVATPRLGSFKPMEGWFMAKTQGFLNIENAKDAERTIKALHKKGYDGVKIYSQLTKESYNTLIKTADELGMPTFGHIPWSVTLHDLWESSQSGVAHFEELMNALNREFGDQNFGNFGGREDEFLAYVEERSEALAKNLIKNDITVTSTLWLTQTFVEQKFELDQILTDVELEYENPGISEWSKYIPGGLGWLPDVNRYKFRGQLSADQLDGRKRYWFTYGKACKILARNLNQYGVKIMAGTDANLPPTVPGFSLHDELQSLNEAGMSPAEVLRSATTVPSEWLNSNAGKIAPGRDANLVLLDNNPLADISNTKSISAVIANGQIFDRSLLDEMLVAVKAANDRSRKIDVTAYIN